MRPPAGQRDVTSRSPTARSSTSTRRSASRPRGSGTPSTASSSATTSSRDTDAGAVRTRRTARLRGRGRSDGPARTTSACCGTGSTTSGSARTSSARAYVLGSATPRRRGGREHPRAVRRARASTSTAPSPAAPPPTDRSPASSSTTTRAIDTLLNTDDYGGIETWQGGPAYVYDNISGNPGGYRSWDHAISPDDREPLRPRLLPGRGVQELLLQQHRLGQVKGPPGKLANTSAFQEIISYQNTFFNNTVYNFVRGSRRQAPQAGRRQVPGQHLRRAWA